MAVEGAEVADYVGLIAAAGGTDVGVACGYGVSVFDADGALVVPEESVVAADFDGFALLAGFGGSGGKVGAFEG